jgi:hypothetical protein
MNTIVDPRFDDLKHSKGGGLIRWLRGREKFIDSPYLGVTKRNFARAASV